MNMQQLPNPKSSANGFGRRRGDRETGPRSESKLQFGKTNAIQLTSVGGGNESPSRERLVYLTTCLIGHHVEVHVLDGSIFSGIFHATNAEKDFGIVLKMARLIKDGSRDQKNISDSVSKPPSKTLIIPAKELVQVIAKGVPVTREGLTSELQRQRQQELMTDSCISQSRHVEVGRELERWVPDEDAPECPELENIFDGPWNRGWDQFEANETLFGVKSTFNEDLYTTKLQKGPQTRDLEREALRIAREIEGEDTHDLHLAEERGLHLNVTYEIDEETRFSSVFRGVDDSGFDDDEDILLDSQNGETFGDVPGSVIDKSFTEFSSRKVIDGAQVASRSSSMEEVQSSQLSTSKESFQFGADDPAKQLSPDHFLKGSLSADHSRVEHVGSSYTKEDTENQVLAKEAHTEKLEDARLSLRPKNETSEKNGLSPNAAAYAPSNVSSKVQEKKTTASEVPEGAISSKMQGASQGSRPNTSASRTSEPGAGASASTAPGLSPSSSVGSLSSEKSTLNPNAKEFKLNPNAKSFIPSQPTLRPASPVSDTSFYYPANVAAVPNMHGVPVGIGIGSSFAAHQPVIFNQQVAPPQPYFHPNGPQYAQQMIIGHPRQVVYMPTYHPEMPYKGRDF